MARSKTNPDRQPEIKAMRPAAVEAPRADTGARQQAIAEAAYYKAEQRGFAPGGETQDWLDAERELGYREAARQS